MSAPAGKRAGQVLMILAWAAGLFLAVRYFSGVEQRRENPNVLPQSSHADGYVEVRLVGNRQGHFVTTARLNGQPFTLMVDTGATDVALPPSVARELGLAQGAPVSVNTANGRADGYRTRLETLQLGDILLRDVRALVIPGLEDDQVLLGMSALKRLEFTQRGGTLLLRQTTP